MNAADFAKQAEGLMTAATTKGFTPEQFAEDSAARALLEAKQRMEADRFRRMTEASAVGYWRNAGAL